MRRWFLSGVCAAVAAVLVGCGEDGGGGVSESDAYELVESYVRRAVTALPDGAELQAAAAPVSVACQGEPPGRVVVRTTYWIRGLTDESGHFDTMIRWWEAHGFEVLDDLRPQRHYVWAESDADGFRMSMRDNAQGELLLGAESPCIATG